MSHESHHLPVEHQGPDSWHRHSAAEGTPQAEHGAIASPGALLIAFIAISVTVALTVLVLQIYFTQYMTTFRAQQVENTAVSKTFNEYKARWEEQDSRAFAVADAKTGAVRIPVESAMKHVLDTYAASPAR